MTSDRRRRKTRAIRWIGTCVGLPLRDLEAYDESEREIKVATFRRLVGPENWREIRDSFPHPPFIGQDWAVQFGRGKWKGKPCVCVHHSSIHHLWELIPE